METGHVDEHGLVQVASLELSGQLLGDISATLRRLNEQIGAAPLINVSCAKLIRVDFIAAGDLLNWVLAKRNENRTVQLVDAHRLVALFFGAMGINEHAKVQVRKV
jgi:ABC-type transporter Mla MlaB component